MTPAEHSGAAGGRGRLERPLLVLAAIGIAGLGLRLFRLGGQSLWYDEGYSVYLAGKGLLEITAETAGDIQPPLYYYLLHAWMGLFGSGEAAVRGLSLLFGLASLPLFYLLGERLFGPRAGWLSAGLAALSPLYIWYAQEARMYTLLVALSLLSCYLLWRALEEADPAARRWEWAGATLAMLLALYTHYFAAFILAFQVIYVLLGRWLGWHRARLREGLIALAAVVLGYAPWLPALFGRYEEDTSYWAGTLKLDEALRKIGIAFGMGETVLESVGQWLLVGFGLALAICALAIIFRPGGEDSTDGEDGAPDSPPRAARAAFLILYLAIPLALLLLATYWTPKFNPRYAMIASPPFFLLLGAGLDALFRARAVWPRVVAAALALFLVGSMAYADYNLFFDVRFSKPDFRGAIRWMEAHKGQDEPVILTSGHAYPVFTYYYPGSDWHPLPAGKTLSTANRLDYGVARDLNRVLDGKPGAWLVLWQDEVADPNGYLTMLLDQYGQGQPVDDSFYHVRLRHYALPPGLRFPEEPQIAHPIDANLGNELTLLGYSPSVTQTVSLYWQAKRPLAEDYKVSLRLKDAAGMTWSRADRDRRLASPLYPTSRWQPGEPVVGSYEIPALPGTPPGTYELEATVYAEGAPQALDLLDIQGAPQGKTARLGPVALARAEPATREDLLPADPAAPPLGRWGEEVALLGFQQDRQDAQAGDALHLTLFWEALRAPAAGHELRVRWVQDGQTVATEAFPPAGQEYPTIQWKAGELLRGQYSLDVPLDIEPGKAELQVGLFAGEGTQAPAEGWVPLTSVKIKPTQRVFTAPRVQYPADANFGDAASLLGGDLSVQEVRPGGALDATLYWKALSRMDRPYTVFVHLLDGESRVRAQQDSVPASGSRPTTGWVPGEVITDAHTLTVDPAAPPGDYVLEVGLYDAGDPSFPRLPVIEQGQAAGNRAIVAKVRVVP